MKNHVSVISVLVGIVLLLSLFFACSSGSAGDDKEPSKTTYAIVVTPKNAISGEAITPNVTKSAKGTVITLTASLGAGRRVALSTEGVTITPATISMDDGTATYTMPAAAVIVTATFSDIPPTLYPVSVNPTGAEDGESITASTSEAAEGTTVTLTASLGAGRRVALSADGAAITPATISADGDTATFAMPAAAVAVTAKFSDIPPTLYPITITPSGAVGSDAVTANVTEAKEGTTVTLTASLGTGRRVALSADDIVINPATISVNNGTAMFTMPGKAVEVTAAFYSVYPITVTPSGAEAGEAVTVSMAEAAEGTAITLTTSLGAGRRVDLNVDGIVINPATISVDGSTATLTMPGKAVEVTAMFYSVYPITVTPSGAETGEAVTASIVEAVEGTSVTLTATLGAGRRVALSASGVTIMPETISVNAGTATFTMPGKATTVTATFSDISYAISVIPSGAASGESVKVNVNEAVKGTTITLTATLGTGKRVALSAAGVTITPLTISANGGKATFTMPVNAVEVRAGFFKASSKSAGTVNFNMHYVPSGGTFIMGQHLQATTQTVTLTKNFWMGETLVTQGLWEAVWGLTWPGTAPSATWGDGDAYPAYNLGWYDVVAFCNLLTISDTSIADTERVYYSNAACTNPYTKANAESKATVYVDWSKKGYRLPTEAEWEYAARYIDGTSWNRGDHVSGGPVYTDETDPDTIGDYAWYKGNNGTYGSVDCGRKEVGQKTGNALGLRDMSGNESEWCYDWRADYSNTAVNDPKGATSGSLRVLRGGHYGVPNTYLCCAHRSGNSPGIRGYGFRLCRTAD